jgi:hypothetical protein
MSNQVSRLKKRLEERKALRERLDEPTPSNVTVEVDGDMPEFFPEIGTVVLVAWGDPNLVNSETTTVPMVVTGCTGEGRVFGQVFTDPRLVGMGPDGRPQAVPSTFPVQNLPYSKEPRPLTWRHTPATHALRALAMLSIQAPESGDENTPEEGAAAEVEDAPAKKPAAKKAPAKKTTAKKAPAKDPDEPAAETPPDASAL